MAAPLGNQNAVKAKRWQQAIDRALERRSKADGIAELDKLAEDFLDAVRAEGISGFREFGDRMDGKPAQSMTLAGDPENPLHVVERRVVKKNGA